MTDVNQKSHRMEREGGPPDLPKIFHEFIIDFLHGRSFDENHPEESSAGQFPDFSCYNGLLLIEMKHLETDQHDRINVIFDQEMDPNNRPLFFGKRSGESYIEGADNAEDIRKAIFDKLSRTVEGLLRKADKQLLGYRTRNPRKNSINICVILNSTLMEYTPEVVGKAIHSKMKTSDFNISRFENIDAVIYISEKHFLQMQDGRVAHPIVVFEGLGCELYGWKRDIVDRVLQRWLDFRSADGDLIEIDGDFPRVETVEDIPKMMSRSEMWLLEYARAPYLTGLNIDELRFRFHRLMAINSLALLKGEWKRPSDDEVMEGMRDFQHLIAETNRRGVDMRLMSSDLVSEDDWKLVYFGLPEELVMILRQRA